MDILPVATAWARAEVFSARFFVFAGIGFVLGGVGFWWLGRTDVARAYVVPTVVAGVLLLIVGFGICYANATRVDSFRVDYEADGPAFVAAELARTQQSLDEYRTIVFRGIPAIIVLAALLIVFVERPAWRASGIVTIGLMTVILLVDSNAKARIEDYRQHLRLATHQPQPPAQ